MSGPPADRLTPQQARFVQEYLIDPTSGARAAVRAGYSINSSAQMGSKLLQKPHVKAAVQAGQAEAAKRMGITQDRVLQELALIAFSNLKDIVSQNEDGTTTIDMKSMSREVAAALGEISVTEKGVKGGKNHSRTSKVALAGKLAALEKLGKHLGMFVEKVEHTGTLTLEQLVNASFEEESDS